MCNNDDICSLIYFLNFKKMTVAIIFYTNMVISFIQTLVSGLGIFPVTSFETKPFGISVVVGVSEGILCLDLWI